MYRKSGDSWLKHLDFIVLDLVALQLAYISSYALRMGAGNLYKNSLYLKYWNYYCVNRYLYSFLYRALPWYHEKRIFCRV